MNISLHFPRINFPAFNFGFARRTWLTCSFQTRFATSGMFAPPVDTRKHSYNYFFFKLNSLCLLIIVIPHDIDLKSFLFIAFMGLMSLSRHELFYHCHFNISIQEYTVAWCFSNVTRRTVFYCGIFTAVILVLWQFLLLVWPCGARNALVVHHVAEHFLYFDDASTLRESDSCKRSCVSTSV